VVKSNLVPFKPNPQTMLYAVRSFALSENGGLNNDHPRFLFIHTYNSDQLYTKQLGYTYSNSNSNITLVTIHSNILSTTPTINGFGHQV
jgi:hypothetical protein